METEDVRPKRRGESIFALILLILGVGLLWQSWKIAGFSALSSPGAFPLAASFVMVLAASSVVLANARNTEPVDKSAILPFNVVVFVVLMAVYAALIEPLGFLPASLLFLFGGIKFLYKGGWIASALLAAVSLAAIYGLFGIVFQVVLPAGIVPESAWLATLGTLFSTGAQ